MGWRTTRALTPARTKNSTRPSAAGRESRPQPTPNRQARRTLKVMQTGAAVELLAEAVGFISAAALTWQAYRLMRHLRTVHELREAAQRQAGRSTDMQE